MPGIAKDNNLPPLQQAFHEHHGLQCGFCNTILYNGEAARSCIMFAVQADGAEIVTVEGKAPPPIFAASRTFSIVCGGHRPREDLAMKFRAGELRPIFRRQYVSVKIDDHCLQYLRESVGPEPSGDAMLGSKINVSPDGNKAGLATIRIKITLMRDLVQSLRPVSD